MPNKFLRWFKALNYPSYVIFFVTAKCNAECKMCFYKDNIAKNSQEKELTVQEYEKISKNIKLINILGISGGEPFLRGDLSEIVKVIYRNCSPLVADLPTNGFFTDSVLRQTQDIARHCRNMIVDLQLSIDGPERVHNQIRGLRDGFSRVRDTYRALVPLRKKYSNLRVKACVVYSYYNQEYMDELFDVLARDFKELDRLVFSVVHGSVSNPEAFQFDWNRYFAICEKIRRQSVVKNIGDFHSLFTIALRIAKNEFLKDILRTKSMYKECAAGRKVIVVGETGKVFPCEPLWQSVGDLRENGYDIGRILLSQTMEKFRRDIAVQKCNCHWGLPLSNALIYKLKYYPKILSEAAAIIARSTSGRHKAALCQ